MVDAPKGMFGYLGMRTGELGHDSKANMDASLPSGPAHPLSSHGRFLWLTTGALGTRAGRARYSRQTRPQTRHESIGALDERRDLPNGSKSRANSCYYCTLPSGVPPSLPYMPLHADFG